MIASPRALAIWVGLLAGMLAASIGASGALASAHFTYELCDAALPQGNPPAIEFHAPPTAPFYGWQDCAAPDSGVGLVIPAAEPTDGATLAVQVPATPGGFVEGETITAFPQEVSSGSATSYVYEPGWPPDGTLEATRYFLVRREATPLTGDGGSFEIRLECGSSCAYAEGIFARDIAVEEVDPVPPAITRVEGTLLGGGTLRGAQDLSAEGTDVGGGVALLEARVDGLPAGEPVHPACSLATVSNPSYRGLVATTPSPCPAKASARWELDTAAPPFREGPNTVQVCVSDLATSGPANTTCSPDQVVEVDDSCVESPVGGGADLTGGFGPRAARTVKLPHGARGLIEGSLSDPTGHPVSGATICIETRIEGDPGGFEPLATATTDARGHFSYRLAPGPDRQVLVGYRHGSAQLSRTLELLSHAEPTLQSSPRRLRNGRRVRLHGRLPGPGAAGRVVVLQANVLGSPRWITFRKATTDARGEFRAAYQFRSTTRPTTYRFRALVPVQAGYPWAQGHSRPTTVRVNP